MNKLLLLLKIPIVRKTIARWLRLLADKLDVVSLAVLISLVLTVGCSTRTVAFGGATYKSVRFLQTENFDNLTVTNTNGVVIQLTGYKNSQTEALAAVVSAAVTAAKH